MNTWKEPSALIKTGLKFTSKHVLKFAIILLGASLNITMILTVGKLSLAVMVFTLLTCFGGGYFIGKKLGLNWKLSNLISAGTGICGGSAIAAIAPVIEAEDEDIAYAMSATFLFDVLMIVLFPIMGKALGLTDMAYGLWAGTAGLIPVGISHLLKQISKFLMVCALASIGLNTKFKSMIKTGLNPFLHGFIISLLVVVVALGVEFMMGIV
ncbi:YeiH family protein [Erysipelothrix piscisicarius]|uniref:YeiH family protein n=1 Tax=Erysipelothrix piscisicarius TaxID=2485784 RepID=UPI002F93ED20